MTILRSALTLLRSRFVHAAYCSSRLSNEGNARYLHDGCNKGIFAMQQSRERQLRSSNVKTRGVGSSAQPKKVTKEHEILDMMTVWPEVLHNLTHSVEYTRTPDVQDWLTRMLEYTVPGGQKLRGFMVTYAYKLLVPPERHTEENVRLAKILGCCVEIFHAGCGILDDIIDETPLRRNKPSWHVHSNRGIKAIGDALLLERCVYQVLRMYFRNKDCYVDLIETFDKISLVTLVGECYQILLLMRQPAAGLDHFTMDTWKTLASNKAGETFGLPIKLAIHFAGIRDPAVLEEAHSIATQIGEFYQMQDDYEDVYGGDGSPERFCDIHGGSLSWLAITALQRATPQQKQILEECYGQNDPDKVQRVKQLYDELDVQGAYNQQERQMYNSLKTSIQNMSSGHLSEIFQGLLGRLFHRGR